MPLVEFKSTAGYCNKMPTIRVCILFKANSLVKINVFK